jgi:hypothetical protein
MGGRRVPLERLAARSPDGRTPGKRRLRLPAPVTPDRSVPPPPEFISLAPALGKPPWEAAAKLQLERAARIGECPECGGPSGAGKRGPVPVCMECKYKAAQQYRAF